MSMSCLAAGTPARGAPPPCALSSTEGAQYQLGPVIASPTSLPSTVQLARQANRLRAVVAKRYSLEAPVREGEEDPMQYIRHEVASMRQLHHPNILPCLAAFSCGTEVWLVTPLMPHGSLADLTKAAFPDGLPELACCLVTRDLCLALRYLHGQGVVHRALRASHVLVSESGSAVVGGLRYCTPLHATGEQRANLYTFPLHGAAGNLCWLAPEILQQNLLGYNETSDIYSLAVTLCELANGLVPFSEMAPTLLLLEKLRGAAPKLMDSSTMGPPPTEEQPELPGIVVIVFVFVFVFVFCQVSPVTLRTPGWGTAWAPPAAPGSAGRASTTPGSSRHTSTTW
jgi:STE20-related kinase adapter protein alpha